MKKLIILLLLLPILLLSKELVIASYNVDNLFDNVNNGTEYSDYILNKHNWNSITFKKKIEHIARVICELNADVIGLQEVENGNALKELQQYLKRNNCKYPYSAITHKRGLAIQVALLSKVKLKHNRDIRVGYASNFRDILKVTLQTTPKLTIYVNHWSSKRAKESARLRSARALVKDIKKLPKSREYIILGDFNSRYNECQNISAKNNDTNRVCGIDTILKTYINGKINKLNSQIEASFYHYNLWSEIAPYKRWSHSYYGNKGAIDSIIIPPNLLDNRGWFYKRGSFGVFKKSYLFKNGSINAWEYKNGKYTGKGYSDHLPIYATFSNSLKDNSKYESFFDKFWKLFVPKVKDSSKKQLSQAKEVSLNELALVEKIDSPVLLKRVCIVFKRGDSGVIKSSKNSKAIMLYKCAKELKEGSCYNLKIYKKKRYFNLDEILDLDILKDVAKIGVNSYIKAFKPYMMRDNLEYIGDIVKNIRGIYSNGYIKVNGKDYKLYIKQKNRRWLKNGSYLYIKKAQIGYYKGEKELVVYSLKDIIKEN